MHSLNLSITEGESAMREKTGCFTGHRRIPEKDYAVIEEKLEHTIVKGVFERGRREGI